MKPKYAHRHPPVNDHPVVRTRKVDDMVRVCRDCGENVIEAHEPPKVTKEIVMLNLSRV